MQNDNKGENSSNEKKLDQWLHQTLESGGQQPNQPIVHLPAPQVPPPAKATAPQPGQAGAKPQQPAGKTTPPQPFGGKPAGKPQGGFFKRNPRNDHPRRNTTHQYRAPQPGQSGPKQAAPQGNTPFNPQRPGAPALAPRPDQKPKGFFQSRFQKPRIEPKAPFFPNRSYRGKLRIIPLGGLDEVGKNCMVLEYEQDIILIDLGYQFPDADLLGVDYIIPDIAYLEDKKDRIRGIVFTHGHLDHIGAVSYLIPKLNFPQMYGAQLTMSLIQKQLEEFKLVNQSRINVITANDVIQLGAFNVSFFNVNHSIPDSLGVMVKTPAGNIVHTGDFKFDFTPHASQKPADFAKISSYGKEDIAALFIDSTNALKPGHTITEAKVSESLDQVVKNTKGRILIASFASQIGRLQDIVDIAKKYGRNVILSGRSLVDNFTIASKLGYLRVPQGLVHEIHKVKKMADDKTLILTTGSQGEDISALSRMALESHQLIKIKKGDTVVLSSSAIPGNEKAISTVINNLSRLGANIINNQIMDVHTSGHAQQEDLKLMMTLVKPKAIVPIHGEYFMRVGNANIAKSLGYTDDQALIIENGDVLEIENGVARTTKEKIETKYILIDGYGVGDIGAQVIMDRQQLAENGVLLVLIPIDEKSRKQKGEIDVISRGFIYMKESEALTKDITDLASQKYAHFMSKQGEAKRSDVKKYLRESLDRFVHEKIDRQPLILPILLEK